MAHIYLSVTLIYVVVLVPPWIVIYGLKHHSYDVCAFHIGRSSVVLVISFFCCCYAFRMLVL